MRWRWSHCVWAAALAACSTSTATHVRRQGGGPRETGQHAAADNATCDGARALTAERTLAQQDTARGGDADAACQPEHARQLYYTVRVPAGTRALVTAQPSQDQWPGIVLRVLASCNASVCENAEQSTDMRASALVVVTNATAQPVDRIVVASGASAELNVMFDLNVRFEPARAPAASEPQVVGRAVATPRRHVR